MTTDTVLITGSTGGIGYETARTLAVGGARVLLVGRNRARAEAAANRLRSDAGNADVIAFTADISRQADVRRLAADVAGRVGRLDVLINNAGVNRERRELTDDGVENNFAVNVLAPYSLSWLLLPLLRRGRGRIVNLTGGIPTDRIDPDNLQAEKSFVGWTSCHYNQTKVAVMAMSLVFAANVYDVTVNVAYPGHAYTPGNRATRATAFPKLYRPVVPILRLVGPWLLGGDAIAKASRSSVHLATSPRFEKVTGKYIDHNCRLVPFPDGACDPAGQRAVWGLCERLSGLPDGGRAA